MFRIWLLSTFFVVGVTLPSFAEVHPLKLSLCEIDYSSSNQLLKVNLKLFLTDVNEALVFDPNSTKLAFCQPNEAPNAEAMLLTYLNNFFYLKIDQKIIDLKIKHKKLKGEGDNVALWIYFEIKQPEFKSIEVKNAVFTDLFFDQNNIVYVHYDEASKSLMLDKKKSVHQLTF